MVPKKNSEKLRPVINLKPLNQFLWKKSFKMDHLGVVMKLLRKGDWVNRFDRCVSSCSHSTKSQKVSQVCGRAPLLSITVPTFRSNNSSSGIHQDAEWSSAILEVTRSAGHGISGRFSPVSESSRLSLQQQGHNTASVEQAGILGESGEIRTSPFTVSEVHRGTVSVESGDCVSDTRAVCQNQGIDSVE